MILYNAKFGDMFKCANGMKAVVIHVSENCIACAIDDGTIETHYSIDGTIYQVDCPEYHIISKL